MNIRLCTGIIALLTIISGCAVDPHIQIAQGIDACRNCNMTIDRVNQACGMIVGNEFVTYDSPMCMLRQIEELPESFVVRGSDIYLADYNTSGFVRADSVVMVLTDHVPTVMHGRVVCFSSNQAAEEFVSSEDEVITDWTGFQTLRGTPDVIVQVKLSSDGMQPELIEANKGELLLLQVEYSSEMAGRNISVRGYHDMKPLSFSPGNNLAEMRLLLTLPGAGFPIIDETGLTYGMIRVAGAHTEEEADL